MWLQLQLLLGKKKCITTRRKSVHWRYLKMEEYRERNWQNNVIHLQQHFSLVVFSLANFERNEWMNEWFKQKWNCSGVHNICEESNDDGNRCTHSDVLSAQRKRRLVGDELPTKWNDSHTKTHILYLIDLVVYYLYLVRLHNEWNKIKAATAMTKTKEREKKSKDQKNAM